MKIKYENAIFSLIDEKKRDDNTTYIILAAWMSDNNSNRSQVYPVSTKSSFQSGLVNFYNYLINCYRHN